MWVVAVLLAARLLVAAPSNDGAPAAAATTPQGCDGWTWLNPLPQGSDLLSVCIGGGRFVAVGSDGAVLASADGMHWSVRILDPPHSLADVVWGNGLFVAVGEGLWTSPDGVEWTLRFNGYAWVRRRLEWGGVPGVRQRSKCFEVPTGSRGRPSPRTKAAESWVWPRRGGDGSALAGGS